MRVREGSALALIILVGLLTSGVMYALLQASPLAADVGSNPSTVDVGAPRVATAADSLAATLPPGLTLVGVPQTGSEPLLRDVQPGDRLDILVSLTGVQGSGPLTAVAVRGATAVRVGTGNDPLLLQVPDSDAIVLAHLLLGGQRLSYVVWSANGNSAPLSSPLPPVPAVDARTVRQVLGLEALPVPPTVAPVLLATPAPAAATPTSPAVASASDVTSGFIYQAQPGDTWVSLANTFGLAPQELRRWNDAPDDAVLVPGSLVIVPRRAR